MSVNEKDLEEGLAIVYELLGWDPETGRPTRDGLHMWGLDDIADGLEAVGRLSETKINTHLREELIEEGERETARTLRTTAKRSRTAIAASVSSVFARTPRPATARTTSRRAYAPTPGMRRMR